ncbi:uncharacterized protein LOC110672232 [Hevea brasiliensis]|uniref:uncharacterized protein LOC110672232 n=1 Tax=Hevea brasiliensis TaxID=3981 RepID=UPI0025E924BF|nr:uncharacterized protein LOC110672232 [Hevea brasiliensis]
MEMEMKKGEIMMMSKNGMKVDLLALGSMEDLYDYGEELRRLTMGMHTEAEMLGALQGLEGEWVTSRRKKKIVNASMLGDVLPRGWKLMLCIKKKAGYFWIACRRYISSNGQQFMSCKEVSSYLLQDIFTLEYDKNGDEKQFSPLKIGITGRVQTPGKYKCHKCTMAFDEPDDLLQHLLPAHQRTSKSRRQGTFTNERIGSDMGTVAINSDIKINDEIISAIPNYKRKENTTGKSYCGMQDIVCSTINNKAEKMSEVANVVAVENYVCPGLNKENDSVCKSSDEKNVLGCFTDRINNLDSQEEGSQNCSLAAVGRKQACAIDGNEDQVCVSLMKEHYQVTGSDSGLIASNSEEKTVDGEAIKDRLLSSTISCMKIDDTVFVGKDKLRTGFDNNCSIQENVATNSKEQSSEGCYGGDQRYGSVNNVHGLSISIVMEMRSEMGSKEGLPSSLDETACFSNDEVNQVSARTLNKPKLDEVCKSRNDVQTVGFGSNNTLIMSWRVASEAAQLFHH